jgi:adenosylhomocysteine nucleosidase
MLITFLRRQNIFRALCAILCIAAVISFAHAQTSSRAPMLAVLTATTEERKSVERELKDAREERRAGILFIIGTLRGRSAVVAATGVGKVNAAATTMLLLREFKPSAVLMSGTAGALKAGLKPGTVVVAEKVAQHDTGTIRDTEFISWAAKNPVDDVRNPLFIPAAKELLAAAKEASRAAITSDKNPATVEASAITGVIVCGDVFVASVEKKDSLRRLFRADAVDMESAAVAQICWQNAVPFLAIRGISDPAEARAGAAYDEGHVHAADNAATVTCDIIQRLAKP